MVRSSSEVAVVTVVVDASAGAGSLGRSRWGREGGGAGARGERRAAAAMVAAG